MLFQRTTFRNLRDINQINNENERSPIQITHIINHSKNFKKYDSLSFLEWLPICGICIGDLSSSLFIWLISRRLAKASSLTFYHWNVLVFRSCRKCQQKYVDSCVSKESSSSLVLRFFDVSRQKKYAWWSYCCDK